MAYRIYAHHKDDSDRVSLTIIFNSKNATRRFTFGNSSYMMLVMINLLLLIGFITAASYTAFHDKAVSYLLWGERENIIAYENRIAELRIKIDKITAKQLLKQESVEDRVANLVSRQIELEARQIMTEDTQKRVASASFSGILPTAISSQNRANDAQYPSAERPQDSSNLKQDNKPTPIVEQKKQEKPRPLPEDFSALPFKGKVGSLENNIQILKDNLEKIIKDIDQRTSIVEKKQIATLERIGESAEVEIQNGRQVFATLGLNPARFGNVTFPSLPKKRPSSIENFSLRNVENTAMGGPILPPMREELNLTKDSFENMLTQTEKVADSANILYNILQLLPLGRPLDEKFEQTSNFGNRSDPFTGSLAFHSGLDYRAPIGLPVRALGKGVIESSGYNGGYGYMVEIDHGKGIATRYAHLSKLAVESGEKIEKGDIIGYVGSTGRSTGSHLHYEVRIDDNAIDPTRFIMAGMRRKSLAAN